MAAMSFGDPVEAIPGGLRKSGAGEKEELEAGEEDLAQLGILLEDDGQVFPGFRDVEIDGGRNFPQVAQGFAEAPGGRLAVVDVQAATVVQGNADVMAAPEGVVPGQPVNQHRRLFGKDREGLQQHLLIGTEHALGGDHGLRQLGRA